MSLTPEELLKFVQGLGADTERWQQHVHHDPDRRTFAQIWDDEDVNAWVLCWGRNHDTGFHDHDHSIAGIIALEGQVREDRLHLSAPNTENIYAAGESFVVPKFAIHRVLHHGDVPAVTIHAYSPPLSRMGTYSENQTGELMREAWDGESAIEASLS
jgi:mannose-6-phosphate isomerase-like protein (cupin superfamily)